jgi:hypothetical protein
VRLSQHPDAIEGLRGVEGHFDGPESAVNQRGTDFRGALRGEPAENGNEFRGRFHAF